MESENKCECNCGNEGNLTLQDSSNVIYKICHNCIFELINLNLSKEHFFNLLKNGHKDNEFYYKLMNFCQKVTPLKENIQKKH